MQNNNVKLGKKTSFPNEYDPQTLTPIDRTASRISTEIYKNKFYGLDRWTCYELSWLGVNGNPKNGVLSIEYSSESPFFIESKSLKLYLNSYHNFIATNNIVIQTITNDLRSCLKSNVSVTLMNKPHPIDQRNLYTSLDHIPHIGVLDNVDKSLLLLSPKKEFNIYKLSCSLFRSLCPVTNQPDWATILIQYKGRYIDESSILSYLLSYRSHKGFHEECADLIYTHIMLQCNPDELSIEAKFLRRGGIDINPFRTSLKEFSYFPYRDLRQ